MALKVGELFASFNLDTSGIDGAVKSAESKMASLGKSLAIGGAGMTAAVTVPLKKAAEAIYESGSGFDAQMSKVFAIAGKSVTENAEVMDALRKKALEMGSETQFTAVEAGEAMEYMAMAGWKSEEMLSAIGPILDLAAAAGADLGTTSDIVTDAMTAFGYAATDTVKVVINGTEREVNAVEHFADVLAAASSNSNTNVTMLGESFKFAAPLAGALGYSVDDVAIALGLMANNGIKSSMAGTSLSRIIQNMVKPTEETAKAMEALGVSLYNGRGEAKSLREIMDDFRSQAKKNNVDVDKLASQVSELDDQYSSGKISEAEYEAQMAEMTAGCGEFLANLTQLAGARGLPGLLAILNASETDFENLCNAIDGATGSASEMKRVMLDNALGDVTIFKSAVEGLEITLWGLAENGFRKVVQEATKYVQAFQKADRSTQLGTLKMGALAAAIGPVMAGIGGVVAMLPKLVKTFTFVSGPAAMLGAGLIALGAAAIDSNNDIGKTFVNGLTRAGKTTEEFGAKVSYQLDSLSGNMGAFLSSVAEGISSGLPGIMNGLGDIIATGIRAISNNMPQIANVSRTIVKTLADSIKRNAPKVVPATLSLLTNMSTALIGNIPVVLEGMAEVITALIREVLNADWGDIGSKLGESIHTSIQEVGTLFKKLAMGDRYFEDADFTEVGSAMMENIRDGISKASQNGKELLGNLVLGDDYAPDESWGTVAGKIWNRISADMQSLLSSAGDLIKGLILGDDYAPDASWGTVASKIWQKIRDQFSILKTDTKDLIGNIVLGDSYTADSSWDKVGQAIWDKVKEKIAALTVDTEDLASAFGSIAGDIVTGIAKFIPSAIDMAGNVFDAGLTLAGAIVDTIASAFNSFDPDLNFGGIVSSLISNITSAIGGVLDFGGKAADAGTMIISSLLDSLIDAMDPNISADGVSEMTERLSDFARHLISGITNVLPKLFEFGGKTVSAGVKLADELVKSISDGFRNSENQSIDLSGVAEGIVNGIVDAISNLPSLAGDVLSAGAQIANSIMTSISEALKNVESSGVAGTLGKALSELVKGLLGAVTDFSSDTNVLGFVQNLGHGIMSALGSIGQFLGSFVGDLLKHLFSREGLSQIFNAGASLVSLLIEGMKSAVGGLFGFLANMVDEILISFGVIDVDAKNTCEQAQAAAESMMGIAKNAFNDFIGTYDSEEGSSGYGDFQKMALLALFGERTGNMDQVVDYANKWTEGFLAEAEDAIENAVGDGTSISLQDWASQMWQSLADSVEETEDGRSISSDTVKSIMGKYLEPFGIEASYLPEEVWESIAKNAASGGLENGNELFSLLLSAILGDTIDPEVADGIADAATAAIDTACQEIGITAEEKAEETRETIMQAFDSGANDFAKSGMATEILNSEEPVSAAALEVSYAAVKQFLMTMSAENGSEIGEQFIGGIIAILEDGTLISTAQTLGTGTSATISNILSGSVGAGIGQNFGAGLANGIVSMTAYVQSAAYSLGLAAAGALSAAIQEGSPSKLTAETGRNFGLGFINSILESVNDAEMAAETVGLYAAASLNDAISQISDRAAEQMKIPITHRSEAEKLATENEKTAVTYASAIANALNGARVVMNGELVGELVTDTVSEGIASRYAGKRYGTV